MIERHLPAFVVITSQVHFDTSLSDKDVRVYGYISALANSKGYCYATNNYLAETFNVSESTIKRTIRSLTEKGYLNPVIMRDSEGMVVERRLFLTFPTPQEPHNDGRVKSDLRGGVKIDLYNNINNNNIYGAVETSTEQSKASLTKKKSKKEKVKVVSEDSIYAKIMSYFNSKDNTKFKANTKEYIENIDAIMVNYNEDDIKHVIDYVRACNYTEKFWRPSTLFRVSNFERSYEFAQKWTSNTTSIKKQELYYFVNVNVNKVMCSSVKPEIAEHLIFKTRDEAEATL